MRPSHEDSPARLAHERARAGATHPVGRHVPFTAEEREGTPAALFERRVDEAPSALAVVAEGERWTYAELDARANGIARALTGAAPGPAVGLLIGNSPVMIAAVLGALKAGRTFVPVDPDRAPPDRVAFIFDDAGVETVVTTPQHLEPFTLALAGRSVIDATAAAPAPERPRASVSRSDLAWIIYTSGSTGRPKGVAQSHGNVVHFITTEADAYRICAEDRCGLAFSSSVNFWYRETLSALAKGASVFPIDVHARGFAALGEALATDGVTLLTIVPSLFRQFVPTMEAPPQHLRVLKLGGEPVLRTDVDLYRGFFPRGCVLINRFGSTETAPVRYHFLDHDSVVTDTHAPIGYPVPGSDLLILDADGRELPPDQSGEIVVRSPWLAVCYWNLPDVTEATFRPDPEDPTRRLYFTGDVGLAREDGCIVHLGRKDQQVQVRGYRVELAEIEIRLRELDDVADAAASTVTDPQGNTQLVGYVVAPGPAPTVAELRDRLSAALPDYMVPTHWVFLEELPRAPNGKVHRKALPAPEHVAQAEAIAPAASDEPATPMELMIARYWRKVLPHVERFGTRDRFFDLGGESLGAMQTLTWIERETGVRVEPMEMGRQTLGQLAAYYERHARRGTERTGNGGFVRALLRRLFAKGEPE